MGREAAPDELNKRARNTFLSDSSIGCQFDGNGYPPSEEVDAISVSGYAVIRPSEEFGSNLTSPLAPRNMPASLLFRVLNRADHD